MRGSLCTVTTIPRWDTGSSGEAAEFMARARFSLLRSPGCPARGLGGAIDVWRGLATQDIAATDLVLGTQAQPGIEARRGLRAGQVLPEFHEREPAAVFPMPGMNIRPVFASALRPVRGGARPCARNTPLLLLSYLPLSCASRT